MAWGKPQALLHGENDFVTIDAMDGVIPHQFACS
jgi:hypothetical protein